MLVAHLEKSVFDFVVTQLRHQCFYRLDFVLIEALEGSMKDEADMIFRLPVHVLLHFGDGLAKCLQKSGLITVHRYSPRCVREMVIAVAAKYRGDSDISLAVAEPPLGNISAAEADHQLVGDGRICLQEPGNAVELGVARKRHVVERELQILVQLLRGLNLKFLNRYLVREKTLFRDKVRILVNG